MENKQYIYSVKAISLNTISEDNLKMEYNLFKIYQPNATYQSFLKYKKTINQDTFRISSFTSSYHTKKEEATDYVVNNIGNIYEADCYEYAAVCTLPLSYSNYSSYQNPDTDFDIYKFNNDTKKFELLDENCDEYEPILKYLWGFIPI